MDGAGDPGARVAGLREVVVDREVQRRWLRAFHRQGLLTAVGAAVLTPLLFTALAVLTARREGPLLWFVAGVVGAPLVVAGLVRQRSTQGRRMLPLGQTFGARLAADGLTVVRDGVVESHAWLEVVLVEETRDHLVVRFLDATVPPVVLPPEVLRRGDAARVRAATTLGRVRRRHRSALPDPVPDPFAGRDDPPVPHGRTLTGDAVPPLHDPVDVDAAEMERLAVDARVAMAPARYRALLFVLLAAATLPLLAGRVGVLVFVLTAVVVAAVWRARVWENHDHLRQATRLGGPAGHRVEVGALPDGFALGIDGDVTRIDWSDLGLAVRHRSAVVLVGHGTMIVLPARAFPPELAARFDER